MSDHGKMLVTKAFHRKAMKAIEFKENYDASCDRDIDLVRQAFVSYINNCATKDELERFIEYCDEYEKEFG